MLGALLVLSVAAGLWGRLDMSFPQAFDHLRTPVPVAVLLPIPFACVIVVSLHSTMAGFEAGAARRVRRIDLEQLGVLTASSVVGLTVGLSLGGAVETVPAALRNLLWWLGVACVSGRMFGRRLAWVLPLAAAIPVYVFGVVDGEVSAWAIPKLDVNVPHSWMVSGAVVLVGIAMISMDRYWRAPRQARRTGDKSENLLTDVSVR
ncbi:hypothetical protein [Streptosporangium sandarakinum]|uniref:Uncharacterized protein n=1 Tax=Streptosporangium sandarakinum TaxID=1260955 RepID=A0A852V2Z8_9ACTN|nr:hypothetical protein [Streptosporangium sandarakinum]NYF40601.1 hypothetical protein [Streptosporangium sandarakinum]